MAQDRQKIAAVVLATTGGLFCVAPLGVAGVTVWRVRSKIEQVRGSVRAGQTIAQALSAVDAASAMYWKLEVRCRDPRWEGAAERSGKPGTTYLSYAVAFEGHPNVEAWAKAAGTLLAECPAFDVTYGRQKFTVTADGHGRVVSVAPLVRTD
jgi:hypothetical protein